MALLCQKLKHYLQNFNLFPSTPPSTDEQELRTQRISTRLYVLLLVLLTTVLLLYISLVNVTNTVSVEIPTLAKYSQLYSTYADTLICPCKKISVQYKEFLHVHYTFHQVCNSDFVSPSWFFYLNNFKGTPDFGDFRVTGTHAFQALAMFCHLINQTISDSFVQFHSTEYISGSITPLQVFQSQAQSFVDQFRSSTTDNLLLSLTIIREMTHNNALLSGRESNYIPVSRGIPVMFEPVLYSNCSCRSLSICISPSAFYSSENVTKLCNIPGFYTGCYVIESLLQSNLECFYDQSCINRLHDHFSSSNWSINVTALDTSLSSQYYVNTTIKQLLDNLMIEEWNETYMYDRYYNQCQPTQCAYTIGTKHAVIYIFTTVTSVVGGLITILKLIVPLLIKFVRKKRQSRQTSAVNNYQRSIRILRQKSKIYLQNFNLFPSTPPSTDEQELRTQRISTRLYIFLLILSLTILLLYTSLINVTNTVSVETPTLPEYSQLYTKYADTLTCPCTKISIQYKEFLHVHYTFHQVCNSDFVTPNWLVYLAECKGIPNMGDFRVTSVYAFQALAMFCHLINKTITNDFIRFYSTEYISGSIRPLQVFQAQAQSFVDQFRSLTTNSFLLSLGMIREMTHNNALLSAVGTNYRIYIFKSVTYLAASSYGNCSCSATSICVSRAVIYNETNDVSLFFVPGFYTGCYVIESLLQSNLECFYDQSCINRLHDHFSSSNWSINVTALDTSLSSQYYVNTTIKQLLDNLMIEEWNETYMYDRYYNQCQPTQCSYSIGTKNAVIYIITTVIGIVGGVITILELIVPRLVKLIVYFIQKWRMRVRRVMPAVETQSEA